VPVQRMTAANLGLFPAVLVIRGGYSKQSCFIQNQTGFRTGVIQKPAA